MLGNVGVMMKRIGPGIIDKWEFGSWVLYVLGKVGIMVKLYLRAPQ